MIHTYLHTQYPLGLIVFELTCWAGFNGSMHTSWSQIERKYSTFLSSFVKRSLVFRFHMMRFILINLFWTLLRMTFSCIWIYCKPLVVKLWLQHTHALLSLKMVTCVFRRLYCKLSSSIVQDRCMRAFMHSSVVYISTCGDGWSLWYLRYWSNIYYDNFR